MTSTADNTPYVASSLHDLSNLVAHMRHMRRVSTVNQLSVALKEFGEDGLHKLVDTGFDIPTEEQIQEIEQEYNALIEAARSAIEIASSYQTLLSITLDVSKVAKILSEAEPERPKTGLEGLQGLHGEAQALTASIDTQQQPAASTQACQSEASTHAQQQALNKSRVDGPNSSGEKEHGSEQLQGSVEGQGPEGQQEGDVEIS